MLDALASLGNLVARVPLSSLGTCEPSSALERSSVPQAFSPSFTPLGMSPEASPQELQGAAEEVNRFLKQTGSQLQLESAGSRVSYSELSFSVDRDSGIAYFQVLDGSTRKVIRQVPSEEVLVMARKLRELSSGSEASGVLMNKEG